MTDEATPHERAAWDAVGPDEASLLRMESVVLAAYTVQHRSLAVEWLELLRARPLTNTLLFAAAAAVLLLATPLGALFALVALRS